MRQELIAAQQEGNDKGVQFNVNNVEIELETVVGKEEIAGGGVKTKFFVLDINADANVKFSHASKQKIKQSFLRLYALNPYPIRVYWPQTKHPKALGLWLLTP